VVVRQYASACVEKNNTVALDAIRLAILFWRDEARPNEQRDSRISDGIVLPLSCIAYGGYHSW
jgi:hypothetical protein